ncbi:SMAD/FHA domain-containing protein [Cubamyces sp. BRFM 1775]|nr:SMAD/FHA domain-containing protein [Cubamyces sp. BRFM 1775]
MPRDYPRSDYRDRDEERSPRYRRDRYPRENDRDDYRRREGSHRDEDEAKPRRRDDDRDRYRDKDQRDDRDRGYGRRRDDDRERERDRDSRRAGPSRRSASPRARSSRPDSRSRSRSAAAEDKAKPNFAPSGLLAAETKTVKRADGTSTVLKYHEPPEARKPNVSWRLYVFKGKEQVDLLHIHRQSAYLIGRDRTVVDIAVEHPSCSKQHAVIQYRQVQEKNEFGDVKTAVKPFIIDLESTNGTIVNDETIPTSRYYELMLGDVIKFGESTREYVLMNEEAA